MGREAWGVRRGAAWGVERGERGAWSVGRGGVEHEAAGSKSLSRRQLPRRDPPRDRLPQTETQS